MLIGELGIQVQLAEKRFEHSHGLGRREDRLIEGEISALSKR